MVTAAYVNKNLEKINELSTFLTYSDKINTKAKQIEHKIAKIFPSGTSLYFFEINSIFRFLLNKIVNDLLPIFFSKKFLEILVIAFPNLSI